MAKVAIPSKRRSLFLHQGEEVFFVPESQSLLKGGLFSYPKKLVNLTPFPVSQSLLKGGLFSYAAPDGRTYETSIESQSLLKGGLFSYAAPDGRTYETSIESQSLLKGGLFSYLDLTQKR